MSQWVGGAAPPARDFERGDIIEMILYEYELLAITAICRWLANLDLQFSNDVHSVLCVMKVDLFKSTALYMKKAPLGAIWKVLQQRCI